MQRRAGCVDAASETPPDLHHSNVATCIAPAVVKPAIPFAAEQSRGAGIGGHSFVAKALVTARAAGREKRSRAR